MVAEDTWKPRSLARREQVEAGDTSIAVSKIVGIGVGGTMTVAGY